MDHETKRRNRITAVAGVLSIGAIFFNGAAASSAGATTLGPSPAGKILTTAINAANQLGSVRVTVRFFSGKSSGLLVEDSGRTSGEQTVAIGKERASIVLLDGTVYFTGNTSGLVKYFGMPQTIATTLANRWISAAPTDSAYASLTAGLTLSSALKEVTPTLHVTKGRARTINGQSTTNVYGTGPAGLSQISLFIAKKGRPLPVEAVGSDNTEAGSSGEIVDFSRWGETLHVPEPTDALPISTLSAASAAS